MMGGSFKGGMQHVRRAVVLVVLYVAIFGRPGHS